MVVAPGGGFRTLSMENEGSNVAKALAAEGVAAFVLKSQGEPAWMFGVVLLGSALGNGLGTLIAPVLRRRVREESILAGSLLAPAIPLVFAARSYGRPAARNGRTSSCP